MQSQTSCRTSAFALALLLAIAMNGCESRDLRGYSAPSGDGQTYLVVDDNNGGQCNSVLVDGKPWTHSIHAPGLISPGRHVIECGSEIEFAIQPATIFHFDYWGP
jgi:hypothetical protein